MTSKLRLAFVMTILFSLQAFAYQLNETQKMSDFNQLVYSIKSGYGPLHYKKDVIGIDLEKLVEEFTPKIKAAQSNREFYYLLLEFVNSFHDGHFNAYVPTDHEATVGFFANWVQGKALIDTIDRDKLPKDKFPFEKGDEVVEVDGISVEDFITENKKFTASGYDLTETGSTVYMLTQRRGSRMPVPTSKQVTYQIRRGTSTLLEEVTLDWEFKGTPLDEYIDFKSFDDQVMGSKFKALGMISSKNYVESLLGDNIDKTYHCSGDTRIDIPKDATVIIKKPFVAYYHPTPKGNIGYLRIPHYAPVDEQGKDDYELRFKQYEYAVSILEENTVGLIIDQDHNCGGSVEYLHNIVSLFVNRSFDQMDFELLANKAEYLGYQKEMKEVNEHTILYQAIKKIQEKVKNAWIRGDFLTEKTHIWGSKTINPHAVHYSKPILMLIDFWSGSGGDAFPSLMQGIGRAKLMGTRTMGLGGHVEEQPALSFSRITYRMTKSLFYRPDGVPVENNGAVPDVDYEITRNDMLYGFKEYQKAYLNELFKIL